MYDEKAVKKAKNILENLSTQKAVTHRATKAQYVKRLKEDIDKARKQGSSWKDIHAGLKKAGIEMSMATLKSAYAACFDNQGRDIKECEQK